MRGQFLSYWKNLQLTDLESIFGCSGVKAEGLIPSHFTRSAQIWDFWESKITTKSNYFYLSIVAVIGTLTKRLSCKLLFPRFAHLGLVRVRISFSDWSILVFSLESGSEKAQIRKVRSSQSNETALRDSGRQRERAERLYKDVWTGIQTGILTAERVFIKNKLPPPLHNNIECYPSTVIRYVYFSHEPDPISFGCCFSTIE